MLDENQFYSGVIHFHEFQQVIGKSCVNHVTKEFQMKVTGQD